MRTIDQLVMEVEDLVDDYYGDTEVDPKDIPRLSVEDVLYSIGLPHRAINEYWNQLIGVAAERYKTLTEHDNF